MSQMIENWFKPELEPLGSILPTVSIHYGKSGFLEDLDDSGYDLREKCSNTHNFFEAWRQLRQAGRLEGLGSEVFVWQQKNAWADHDNHARLLDLYRKIAGDRPIILVQDAFKGGWTPEGKAHAAKLNIVLVMVAVSMTMPAQLTDLEFAFAAKATESREKARMALEKMKTGTWPLVFDRADYHRLILVQHRKTVEMNSTSKTVVLGSIRTGLLARRPLRKAVEIPASDGPMYKAVEIPADALVENPDNIQRHFKSVYQEALDCKALGQIHWSMNADKRIVTVKDNRGFGPYVMERETLPLERPIYTQQLEDILENEYCLSEDEVDPFEVSDLIKDVVTEKSLFGTFLERHDKASLTLSAMTDAVAQRFRRERTAQRVGHCTCKTGKLGTHSESCAKFYFNVYNKQVAQTVEEKRFKCKMVALEAKVKLAVAARRKMLRDRATQQVQNTDAGMLAKALCNEVSVIIQPDYCLVQLLGVKIFGANVYSLKNETGGTNFNAFDLPMQDTLHQRKRIFSMLGDTGSTPSEFFEELRANKFCIDYALLALSNKRSKLELDTQALAVAAKCIPVGRAWTQLPKNYLCNMENLPTVPFGAVSQATIDMIAQFKRKHATIKRRRFLASIAASTIVPASSSTTYPTSTVTMDIPVKAPVTVDIPVKALCLKAFSPGALISKVVPVNSPTSNPSPRMPVEAIDCRVADDFASHPATKAIPFLGPRDWLTDDHVQLTISHITTVLQPRRTAFIGPCVIEAALFSRTIWRDTFQSIRAENKSQVVLFLNNQHAADDFDPAEAFSGDGTHWSILTLSLETRVACHWDSKPSIHTNLKVRKVYESLTSVLSEERWRKYSEVQHKTSFVQTDGYNCGIYAWLHAVKFICDTESICWPFKSNLCQTLRERLMMCIRLVNLVVARRDRARGN